MPQAVADIVRTTLGPRAMLKMLLDASGGAVLFGTLSGLASSVLQPLTAWCAPHRHHFDK